MSVLHVIRCEMFEKCKQQVPIAPATHSGYLPDPPETWNILIKGSPHKNEPKHFCSDVCLTQWMFGELALHADTQPDNLPFLMNLARVSLKMFGSGVPTAEQVPQTKMRRFLLIDGETADEMEGVKWGNEYVSLDPEKMVEGKQNHLFYGSWNKFKDAHPGDGIQWIDQEVKSEPGN